MNFGKTVKAWSAGLILSVATSFASAGPIATMTLDFQDHVNKGFPDGYRNGTINYGDDSAYVRAGMFRFSVDTFANTSGAAPVAFSAASVLDAFCVDIHTTLAYGSTEYSLWTADKYFENSPAGTAEQVGQLYSGAFSSVTDGQKSAAFQLALWEIVSETDENSIPHLGSGSFTANDDFGSAISDAGGWLKDLGSFESQFDLYVLSAEDGSGNKLSQDLLVVSPKPTVKVPEPGTLALLALGICALLLRKKVSRKHD